jgi:pentose-5-phosphate-3-epimerase
MGSDNIGHHGEELDPAVLDKIRDFKKKYPEMVAGVDIGVNHDTAGELVEAGATRLVSGSAIFYSENIICVSRIFYKYCKKN